MTDLLQLSEGLPEVELAPGEVLVREGTRTGSIWILVAGSLRVLKDDTLIHTLARPGEAFGEVAVLLDGDHSATVVAASPSRLRYAADGRAFLLSTPEVVLDIAAGLAERLDLVTAYLADLRHQYAGAPGLTMVSEVLGQLVGPGADEIHTGSAREPDPET